VRTRRALLNFGSGAMLAAVTMLLGLVATPLLLGWLGEEKFGAFRAAADWLGYLMLLELGIGGALLALLAQSAGERDGGSMAGTLATGLRAYVKVTAAMLGLGLLLVAFFPRLIPLEATGVTDLQRGGLIGVATVALLPAIGTFRALIESQQKGYWINILLLIQSLTITLSGLWFAWLGWGVSGQFVATTLGMAAFALPLTWYGFSRYPGLLRSVWRGGGHRESEKRLKSLNRPTLVVSLCGRFAYQSDTILVALLLGPLLVVPLFITQRLATLVQSQLQNVGNASWAALAELHFTRKSGLFNERLIELTRVVSVLGIAALLPVAIYNQFFVGLWVGSERYGGMLLTITAVANGFLMPIFSLWGWCFGGTGKIREMATPLLIQTFVNVVASIGFTLVFGVAGPLLGTLVSLLAVSVWYFPVLLHRVFETPVRPLLIAAFIPPVVAIPYAGVVAFAGSAYPPAGWLELIVHMSLAGAGFLLFWWFTMLDRGSRTFLLKRISSSLRRAPA